MSSLRILLTNFALENRTGSELFVRDLALALSARGHTPIAYSPSLGEVAEELRYASIPVVDDVSALGAAPDLIHGQHHLETMTALLRFPETPAIFVCHGFLPWEETPLVTPRIARYVAVDHPTRDRLVYEHGIPEDRVRSIPNFVDLDRFAPRPPLPEQPRRALLFNSYFTDEKDLAPFREACTACGLELDALHHSIPVPVRCPERLLVDYDLVFATGRSALEAMAVGAALIPSHLVGVGPMVTSEDVDRLRSLNFGLRILREPLQAESLIRQIARYDAADATRVSKRIRATAGLDRAVEQWIELYREVLAERREVVSRRREGEAAARYLRSLAIHTQEINRDLAEQKALASRSLQLQDELEATSRSASGAVKTVKERDRTIHRQQNELEEVTRWAKDLAGQVSQRDERILQLQGDLAERQAGLAALEVELKAADSAAEEEQAEWVRSLLSSSSWEWTRPLRRLRRRLFGGQPGPWRCPAGELATAPPGPIGASPEAVAVARAGNEIGPAAPFVVGVARSGTTLLRLMLDSHPELCIPPETGFIPEVAAIDPADGDPRERFVEVLLRSPTWADFDLDERSLRNVLPDASEYRAADCLRAFYRLCAARDSKPRWGDKTPLYCLHLDTVEALLSEARFIHILRDVRDVFLSVRGLTFAPGRTCETIARDWCDRIRKARELGAGRATYLEVRYETLVRDPVTELRRICAFVDLDFDQKMLSYPERAAGKLRQIPARRHPDGTVQVTRRQRLLQSRFLLRPPEASRVFRWKRELSGDDRARIEAVAGELLVELGYEVA